MAKVTIPQGLQRKEIWLTPDVINALEAQAKKVNQNMKLKVYMENVLTKKAAVK